MHPNRDSDAIPDKPTEQALPELIGVTRDADHAIRRLTRLTIARPSMTPADVAVALAHLADAVAAIPQVAAQLSDILDRSRHTHLLVMDDMTETVDPELALDTARLHLDAVRDPAVDLYRRLDAAHNETAHISSERHVTHDETTPPEPDRRRRRPEDHHQLDANSRRGPAR